MSTQDVMNEICEDIADSLEGSGLTFALVMWMPGRADDARAMGVVVDPAGEAELKAALATATSVTLR